MKLKSRHRLIEAMEDAGISQRELARRIGLKSHGYIGALVRGEAVSMRPERACLMAHELNIGVGFLFLTQVDEKKTQVQKDRPVQRQQARVVTHARYRKQSA